MPRRNSNTNDLYYVTLTFDVIKNDGVSEDSDTGFFLTIDTTSVQASSLVPYN